MRDLLQDPLARPPLVAEMYSDDDNDGMANGYSSLASPRSTEDRVVQLIRFQSFDGSFPPTTRLLSLLGSNVSFEEARTLRVPKGVWATVLAIAYLKQHMKDQPELLESLVEKATEFIVQTPGVDT